MRIGSQPDSRYLMRVLEWAQKFRSETAPNAHRALDRITAYRSVFTRNLDFVPLTRPHPYTYTF